MSLSILTAMSKKFGQNPELVLAGGGNTSYKDKEILYVKGSGTALGTIKAEDFVKIDRRKLAKIWEKEYPADTAEREAAVLCDIMNARCEGEGGKRPSVETALHDLLPYKYVVHLHPALVNGLTCSVGSEETAKKILCGNMIWIEAIEPGYVLARRVREKMQEFKAKKGFDAKIVVLQNHGIFVAADIPDEIEAAYDEIMKKLSAHLTKMPDFTETKTDRERAALIANAIKMLLTEDGKSAVTYSAAAALMDFIKTKKAFEPVSSAFTPDHIIYCGPCPLYIEYKEEIEEEYHLIEKGIRDYVEKYGFGPKIIAVQNTGVFAWGTSKKNADTAMSLFFDTVKISVYSKSFGGYRFLPQKLIDFIVNWEAESYRSKAFDGENR